MPRPLDSASSGIVVKEIDLTLGSIVSTSDKVAGIVGPFSKGPVDLPTAISNENELLNVFGEPYPTDKQYEHWLVASSYLSYGGSLRVVRADDPLMKNGFIKTPISSIENVKIKSQDHYIELEYDENPLTGVMFAAKNPGSWSNGIRVSVIDSRADQILHGVDLSGLQVGYAVTQSLNGIANPGIGTISILNGYIKGYITGINFDANSLDVKILSYISNDGEEYDVDYYPEGVYKFSNTGIIGITSLTSPFSYTLKSYSSQLDWYDQQTIQISGIGITGTTINWNNIAPRPQTTKYASERNSRFDELHVVVVDSLGTISGNVGTILEKHLSLSKAKDAEFSVGSSSYWRKYIEKNSQYIFALDLTAKDAATPVITLSISPTTIIEDGIPCLVYTFTRTGSTNYPITVDYTVSGTATIDVDYTGISTAGEVKSVTFLSGSSTATVTVCPTDDNEVELDETVILTLISGEEYTVGNPNSAIGTIISEDLPIITLSLSPESVLEDDLTSLVFTFTRTGPTISSLNVNYTVDGTATIDIDYTGISSIGTIKTATFGIGSSTTTVTVNPIPDSDAEEDETVILTLSSGSGYVVGTPDPVIGTILNVNPPTTTYWWGILGRDDYYDQYAWNMGIDGNDNIYITFISGNVVNYPDDDYVDTFENPFIAKVDKDGNLIYKKDLLVLSDPYEYVGKDNFIALKVNPDGSHYISFEWNSNYYTAKFDSDGDPIWKREFVVNTYFGVSGFINDPYGDPIIVSTDVNGSYPRGMLYKYDGDNGNLLTIADQEWQYSYQQEGYLYTYFSSGYQNFNTIEFYDNYTYIISGFRNDISEYAGSGIIKIDVNGNVVWALDFGPSSPLIKPTNIVSIAYGNGHIYGVGSLPDSNPNSYNRQVPYIVKLDSDGNVIWQKKLSNVLIENATQYGAYFDTVSIDSNDNIYACGTIYAIHYYEVLEYTLIVKFNSAGDIEWQRGIHNNGKAVYANIISVDSNNDIIVTTQGYVRDSGDVLVFKLPSDGSRLGDYGNGGEVLYGIEIVELSLTDSAATISPSFTTVIKTPTNYSNIVSNNITEGLVEVNEEIDVFPMDWIYTLLPYFEPTPTPNFYLFNDTGLDKELIIDPNKYQIIDTNLDNISSDGTIIVSNPIEVVGSPQWEYSTNGGANWTTGVGNSFVLSNALYEIHKIHIRYVGSIISSKNKTVIVINNTAPLTPTSILDVDSGTNTSDGISVDGRMRVLNIQTGFGVTYTPYYDLINIKNNWEYSIDGGLSWNIGNNIANNQFVFDLDPGTYSPGSIQVRQTSPIYGLSSLTGSNSSSISIIVPDPKPMAILLYNGSGETIRSIKGTGFEPGMVWYRPRNPSSSFQGFTFHNLATTSIGGSQYVALKSRSIRSSSNNPYLSYDLNGFTLLDGSSIIGGNESGRNYVAYAWPKGSALSDNTDGSITSKLSVNNISGYSVFSYVGSGSNGSTFGHGLGSTPDWIYLSEVFGSQSYGTVIGNNFTIQTGSSSPRSASTSISYNSSLITLNSSSFNLSATRYYGFAFKSVAGFSSFGNYTGNGTSTRSISGLGFTPRMIILKSLTTTSTNWFIVDDLRSGNIFFNTESNESASKAAIIDIDGFTIQSGFNLNVNASQYIYMAFGGL